VRVKRGEGARPPRESWFTRSHTDGVCGMIPRPACGAGNCLDSGTAGRGSFPQTSGVRSADSGCAARVGAKSAPHPPPYPVRGRLFGHLLPARGEKGTDMACARGGAAVRVHPGSVEFDSLSPRAGRGCRRRVRGERRGDGAAPDGVQRSVPHPPPDPVRGRPSGHLLPASAGEGNAAQFDRCSIAATARKRSARRFSSARRLARTAGSSALTITLSKNASTCGRRRARWFSTVT
jgi:hypothetical protein